MFPSAEYEFWVLHILIKQPGLYQLLGVVSLFHFSHSKEYFNVILICISLIINEPQFTLHTIHKGELKMVQRPKHET